VKKEMLCERKNKPWNVKTEIKHLSRMVRALNPHRQKMADCEKCSEAALPLLVGAIFLQGLSPFFFGGNFFASLLLDDFSDILIAGALFFSFPYRYIKTKCLALFYLFYCIFAILNNVAVEAKILDLNLWRLVTGTVCLWIFGFVLGWVIELNKHRKNR
jgi:hypothetical protein